MALCIHHSYGIGIIYCNINILLYIPRTPPLHLLELFIFIPPQYPLLLQLYV